ncbi:MAG: nucleotidyltransferase family protein [Candidatus Tectomicrobia bacterium]|nr:nucleotidyltransferase family protein [Candidatus Tectomicrobia bacterium]
MKQARRRLLQALRRELPPGLRLSITAEVVKLAASLRVAPLLYRRLAAHPSVRILPQHLREIEALYYSTLGANVALLHELGGLLATLAAHRIPVVVLKGAALLESVYEDIGTRCMEDIDLLIAPPDAARTTELLKSLGYVMKTDIPLRRRPHTTPHQLPGFVHPQRRSPVEVHLAFVSPPPGHAIRSGEVWERASPCLIAAQPGRRFAAEDLLLHAALHATYMDACVGHLYSLCDAAAILERCRLDWPAFVQRANAYRVGAYCRLYLRLAQRLLGVPIPDGVLQDLSRFPHLSAIEERLMEWLAARLMLPSLRGRSSEILGPWLEVCLSTSRRWQRWGWPLRLLLHPAPENLEKLRRQPWGYLLARLYELLPGGKKATKPAPGQPGKRP